MSNIKNISSFIRSTKFRLSVIFLLTLIVTFSGLSVSNDAYAQQAQCTIDNSTGRDTTEFAIQAGALVQTIITKVTTKLLLTSEMMYAKIVSAPNFIVTMVLAVSLFIMIYGILFVTGMAQIKFYDFIMMLIKIGIIFMLFTPTAWQFFSLTVVKFFNEGTIELINYFTHTSNIHDGIRDIPILGGATAQTAAGTMAFSAIDSALNKVFSSKLFVVLMAAVSSSDTYGWAIAALMALGIWLFLMSLMTALWVYIMSLIMKTLLFGLAPIFIPTILFKRTRHLFDNWLNQIVSASLQPILLFIFFIFFVKLMESSIDNILAYPVCWAKLPEGWRGTAMDWYFWQFAEYKGGDTGWIPPETGGTKPGFPIPIIHIFTFLILAELSNRFNKVVVQIAMQISQASVSLMHEGAGMFSSLTMASKRLRGYAD